MNEENGNFIKTSVEEIKTLLKVENFIGEPIETEDKILIPFMKYGFGFGVGKGKSDEKGESGTTSGGGLGAGSAIGVEPVSLVVVDKKSGQPEGVKVLNISKGNETNKAISDLGIVVTDIVKEVLANKDKKEDKKEKLEITEES